VNKNELMLEKEILEKALQLAAEKLSRIMGGDPDEHYSLLILESRDEYENGGRSIPADGG